MKNFKWCSAATRRHPVTEDSRFSFSNFNISRFFSSFFLSISRFFCQISTFRDFFSLFFYRFSFFFFFLSILWSYPVFMSCVVRLFIRTYWKLQNWWVFCEFYYGGGGRWSSFWWWLYFNFIAKIYVKKVIFGFSAHKKAEIDHAEKMRVGWDHLIPSWRARCRQNSPLIIDNKSVSWSNASSLNYCFGYV